MISITEMKKRIEEMGYYATEELIYDAYNALLMFDSNLIEPGQDIYAITLEGPPGAGKTEFAKTYTKIANSVFNDVEMVDYQCDATTGKTELFEDINISAAIRGDADNVNIPGKLIEAIKKVNEGKRVVLFIDEYDKAREETDAFLLQFLQSGKINSTQHGDLEIKDEYKTNLQVILCKNDMREELSGPLSRRTRKIELKEMTPEVFFKVANNSLVENRKEKIDDGLINLVTLMYKKAYDNKELYNCLPSCSEMLTAIADADRIMKKANAPKSIVYNIITRNMFKNKDDIITFNSSLDTIKNENESKLSALIKAMQIQAENIENVSINSLIASKVFNEESQKLIDKTNELQKLIDTYKVKFANKEKELDEEEKIKLNNGMLVKENKKLNIERNFNDESLNIKRGFSIYDLSSDWTEVGNVTRPNLEHSFYIETLRKYAIELGVTLFEDGVLLSELGNCKLVAVKDVNGEYKLMSSTVVLSSGFLKDINNYIKFVNKCYEMQPKVEKTPIIPGIASIDALVYEKAVDLDFYFNFKQEDNNVYHIFLESVNSNMTCLKLDEITKQLSSFVTPNEEEIIEASNKLINKKVLTNE